MTSVACGLMLWYLISILMIFFDYPVAVSIEILNKKELIYPAVTICNMNPVKASAMKVRERQNLSHGWGGQSQVRRA